MFCLFHAMERSFGTKEVTQTYLIEATNRLLAAELSRTKCKNQDERLNDEGCQ